MRSLPANLLRIVSLSLLLGALVGGADCVRLAWFYPRDLGGPLGAAGWITVYSGVGLLVLGFPVALLAVAVSVVPRWRRELSCVEILIQMFALVGACAYLVWNGLADYLLFSRNVWSSYGARAATILLLAVGIAALLGRSSRPRRAARVQATLALVGVGAVLLVCPLGVLALEYRAPAGVADGPNVVLVVLDTVRADEFYRALDDESVAPRLARLAREGTLYSNLHATATWTLPTHGSLFTGLAPRSHGARRPDYYLAPHCVTLAQLLERSGYETACISNNPWVTETRGILRGFRNVWTPSGAERGGAWLRRVATRYLPGRFGDARARRSDDKNSGHSIELARTLFESRGEEAAPFFLFINLMNAHLPYLPPAPYPKRFAPDLVGDPRRLGHYGGPLDPDLDPERARGLRQLYRASIAYMDEVIGDLADDLRARGLLDETVFIVTSDHGEDLGEHRVMGHNGPPWRTTTWVPMIVRYPSRMEAGRRDARLASQIDLLPTLLDLLELEQLEHELPYAIDGRSLLDENRPREWVVSESLRTTSRQDGWPEGSTEAAALVGDRLRLLWVETSGFQLLSRDEEGREQIVDDPEAVASLTALLEAWRSSTPTLAPQGTALLSEEEKTRLSALGYVDIPETDARR